MSEFLKESFMYKTCAMGIASYGTVGNLAVVSYDAIQCNNILDYKMTVLVIYR